MRWREESKQKYFLCRGGSVRERRVEKLVTERSEVALYEGVEERRVKKSSVKPNY